MTATPAALALVLAAAALRAGPEPSPHEGERVAADRAAAEAATWIGAVSAEDVLTVSRDEADWWVLDACGGAAVVLDVLPAGSGIVEAALLDAAGNPLAHARSAEGGGRIHWIARRSGRLYLRVGPAPGASAPRSAYRLRAWWADAMTCPPRAGAPPPAAPEAPLLPATPPAPSPGPPATERPASPPTFAVATPEDPSPGPPPEPPGQAGSARSAATVPGGPTGEPASAPTAPGVREHDGFLWRLTLGVGYAGWAEHRRDYYRDESRWEGSIGGGLQMAFGGSATETYYLYLELDANFPQVFGLGAGFGAYMGDNWFLDGSIGFHLFENGYLAVTFGKEWWVGEQWLTGLSVRWMLGTGWAGEEDEWTTSATLNLSLTYN